MRTASPIDEETTMSIESVAVARYRDRDGAEHSVIVRVIDGGWEVVDENGDDGKLVEALSDPPDDLGCAEAIARDYARQAVEPAWALVE
jgi:hypothetical protein